MFALNVVMTLKPDFFGLTSTSEAVKISFVMVAIWWLVFSFPLFINVKEDHAVQQSINSSSLVIAGFVKLWQTFKELFKNKPLLIYLCAYLFYFDGVNTIIKMAVDYGLALGFDANNLITALLITQFVGFPAAIVFGFLGEKKDQ